MTGILLTTLKIIGWILLIILLLLLILIFVTLFVSIKYRIAFENEEHLQIRLSTRWLFPLFYLKGNYQTGQTEVENPQFQFYVMGFRIAPRNKKTKAKDETETVNDDQPVSADEKSEPQLVAMEMSSQKKSEERAEDTADDPEHEAAKTESDKKENTNEKEDINKKGKQSSHRKKSRLKKEEKGNIFSAVQEKYASVKSLISDEGNQRAVHLLLSEIKYLLKHYGPRSMRGHVEYATGDPANTGLVTGAISLCPFVYGKKMNVIPDFESETFYVRGNACLVGHIRLIHVLKSIIVLFFDKNIRRLAYQLKK